jgi:hypothetical protein
VGNAGAISSENLLVYCGIANTSEEALLWPEGIADNENKEHRSNWSVTVLVTAFIFFTECARWVQRHCGAKHRLAAGGSG